VVLVVAAAAEITPNTVAEMWHRGILLPVVLVVVPLTPPQALLQLECICATLEGC